MTAPAVPQLDTEIIRQALGDAIAYREKEALEALRHGGSGIWWACCAASQLCHEHARRFALVDRYRTALEALRSLTVITPARSELPTVQLQAGAISSSASEALNEYL